MRATILEFKTKTNKQTNLGKLLMNVYSLFALIRRAIIKYSMNSFFLHHFDLNPPSALS